MSRVLRALLATVLLSVGLTAAPVSTSQPTDQALAAGGYIYNSPISGGVIYARGVFSGVWHIVYPGQGISAVSSFRTGGLQSAEWMEITYTKARYICHPNTYCLIGTKSIQINKVGFF